MTKLEKLYSIIENTCEVGVKLSKDVLLQVEELEEGIIKEEIWHRQAIDTFIDALRKIGLARIPEVGIEHGNGFNLVGKEKRPTVPGRIWQHECDGWYIYSNISNDTKKDDLQRISNYYHLGLKVEEGKPE